MSDVTITVNITELAKKMKKQGFTKDMVRDSMFTGWSNTIIDLLEDDYGIETKVRDIILKE